MVEISAGVVLLILVHKAAFSVVFTRYSQDGAPRQSRTVLDEHHLTEQQIYDLAIIVFEENGACLSSDELDEQIALLLEDVAGFEMASAKAVRRVINQIRNHYHVTSSEHEDH